MSERFAIYKIGLFKVSVKSPVDDMLESVRIKGIPPFTIDFFLLLELKKVKFVVAVVEALSGRGLTIILNL